MRLQDAAAIHGRLLRKLAGQISNRLETEFRELPGADGPRLGIALVERGRTVVIEIPEALLASAGSDPAAREAIRVRIKARRDRMLFRPPPVPLPKHIPAALDPAGPRFGSRFGFGRGRR